MTPENLLRLRQLYPTAFQHWERTLGASLEAIAQRGFTCGDGWLTVVEPILARIEQENRTRCPENYLSLALISSQFETIRIRCRNATPEILEAVDRAIRTSALYCETCGLNIGDMVRVDADEPGRAEYVDAKCVGSCPFRERFYPGRFS